MNFAILIGPFFFFFRVIKILLRSFFESKLHSQESLFVFCSESGYFISATSVNTPYLSWLHSLHLTSNYICSNWITLPHQISFLSYQHQEEMKSAALASSQDSGFTPVAGACLLQGRGTTRDQACYTWRSERMFAVFCQERAWSRIPGSSACRLSIASRGVAASCLGGDC